MLRTTLVTAALAGCLGIARGQDNQAKADQLRREIAELRVKLAEKEMELVKASPAKEVPELRAALLSIGEAGYLVSLYPVGRGQFAESKTSLEVEKGLGDRKFLAFVGPPSNDPGYKRRSVIVGDYPTADLADGRVISDLPPFRVVRTEKVGDRTLYVLEPHAVMKK